MRPHPAGCRLTVALRYRLHDSLMFIPGFAQAFSLPQLGAPEGVESSAHRNRLFGKEAIVSGAIYTLMEFEVKGVVGIEITPRDQLFGGVVQFYQMATLKRCHPIGRQPDAHCFDLGRCLEHVHDTLRRHPSDDNTASRTNLDKATDRQLT